MSEMLTIAESDTAIDTTPALGPGKLVLVVGPSGAY